MCYHRKGFFSNKGKMFFCFGRKNLPDEFCRLGAIQDAPSKLLILSTVDTAKYTSIMPPFGSTSKTSPWY